MWEGVCAYKRLAQNRGRDPFHHLGSCCTGVLLLGAVRWAEGNASSAGGCVWANQDNRNQDSMPYPPTHPSSAVRPPGSHHHVKVRISLSEPAAESPRQSFHSTPSKKAIPFLRILLNFVFGPLHGGQAIDTRKCTSSMKIRALVVTVVYTTFHID